jgi:hypothetical protein
MAQHFDSHYNQQMRTYEDNVRAANASNQEARAASRQEIEDSLVAGGIPAIDAYVATLDERWEEARCLAVYDGLRMGYGIAERARARVMEANANG